jgi:hypothetical protein
MFLYFNYGDDAVDMMVGRNLVEDHNVKITIHKMIFLK